MTTANELISQAAGLLGIRSAADPLDGTTAAIMLDRLNTMLDAWRLSGLNAYATAKVPGTLPASTATRTIGPTGQLVVDPRPIRLEDGCKFTLGGIDYPIEFIDEGSYERIEVKAIDTLGPTHAWYNPTLPNGVVTFWPRAQADVALSLVVLVQVGEFAALTTDVQFAPGYRRAIVFSLAEECATDFEREVPPSVVFSARNARRTMHRANHRLPQLQLGERMDPLAAFIAGV